MNRRHSLLLTGLVILAILVGYTSVSLGAGAQTGAGNSNEPGAVAAAQVDTSNERPHTPMSATDIAGATAIDAAGPAYLMLPPAAFSSDGSDPDGFFMSFYGGYFTGMVTSGACILAPVNLPVGATITSLSVRAMDNNDGDYEWFDLYRINLATGTTEVIGSTQTPTGLAASPTWYTDTSITTPTVTTGYAYQVTTCTRTSINVYAARIGYQWSGYAPLMRNNK